MSFNCITLCDCLENRNKCQHCTVGVTTVLAVEFETICSIFNCGWSGGRWRASIGKKKRISVFSVSSNYQSASGEGKIQILM